MNLAIVIPACHSDDCIEALRRLPDGGKGLIVWDGTAPPGGYPKDLPLLVAPKPFSYPRNVNFGIGAALRQNPSADILLLDDNAFLRTEAGIEMLAETARLKGVGLVGPRIEGPASHQTAATLARIGWIGTCFMWINHEVLRAGCTFDEDYGQGYGFIDADFCRQVRAKGFEIRVDERCVVRHELSRVYPRERPTNDPAILKNRAVFARKWWTP